MELWYNLLAMETVISILSRFVADAVWCCTDRPRVVCPFPAGNEMTLALTREPGRVPWIKRRDFAYSYDDENRLVSVTPANPVYGSRAIENGYDHRSRSIRKVVKSYDGSSWNVTETRLFVWDGWNIVFEQITFSDNTTRTVEYFWGNDLSGSEQGAGGVGGLLVTRIDGVFYIPVYGANGNIMMYVSESGSIAAQYDYDPYGNVLQASGSLASQLSFGFSTKYHDREVNLVAYQLRTYNPALGRWLNRDPIEEAGGENLYRFAEDTPIFSFDVIGLFSWEILPKRFLYDLGDIDSPKQRLFENISYWPMTKPRSGALAITGLRWNVDVKCKCKNNLWIPSSAKGFVIPVIHMRTNRFTSRLRKSIIQSEDEHISDWTVWFRGRGSKFVDQFLNEVATTKANIFKSKILCEVKNSNLLREKFSDELLYPSAWSHAKWDLPDRYYNRPAKHTSKVKLVKGGVYDLDE